MFQMLHPSEKKQRYQERIFKKEYSQQNQLFSLQHSVDEYDSFVEHLRYLEHGINMRIDLLPY